MNKKELATVVALILLIPVWLYIDATFVKPFFPDPEPPAATPTPPPAPAAPEHTAGAPESEAPALLPAPELAAPEPRSIVLSNAVMSVTLSNRGAKVTEVVLHRFPDRLRSDDPVRLDFANAPALLYDSPGLDTQAVFEMSAENGGVVFSRVLPNGLVFRREVSLDEKRPYVLRLRDSWRNDRDSALLVPELPLWLGAMYPRPEVNQRFGPFLGIDARHTGGIGTRHYVKDISKAVGRTADVWEHTVPQGLDWFGVKNKFFTQVLTLEKSDWPSANALVLRARRGDGDARIGMVRAAARLGAAELPPGRTLERRYTYYAGPIQQAELAALGLGQEEVIDFRLWRIFVPIGKALMSGLTGLHRVTGNWGWAIILLTFAVRMLFWPLTQKGAENMKRMSQYAPEMKELRERYKNNPQKLNQAMAEFYKEHKINPMAGCLPMFVQIPVFIALYGTLRVAVELRFADFLWVRDLSEQENLFQLFGIPVNILPLTMGATMIWQQRMTPGTMDDQQRKIMMMMPIVFLFISYNMPSGLLLYWTTSNLISIYQSWHTKRREARNPAAAPAPASASPLAKKTSKGAGKKR